LVVIRNLSDTERVSRHPPSYLAFVSVCVAKRKAVSVDAAPTANFAWRALKPVAVPGLQKASFFHEYTLEKFPAPGA
jgi:hypothetical protein